MIISVEISLYPLDKNYSNAIRHFIDRLHNQKGIIIKVQEMSSFLCGEYDDVMRALTEEIKVSFSQHGIMITVLKIVNLDMTEQ